MTCLQKLNISTFRLLVITKNRVLVVILHSRARLPGCCRFAICSFCNLEPVTLPPCASVSCAVNGKYEVVLHRGCKSKSVCVKDLE